MLARFRTPLPPRRRRSRLTGMLTLALPLLVALLPGIVATAPVGLAQSGTLSAASGDSAGLVDIGDGRRMYLECRGSGAPVVILEAGYRSPATLWSEDLLSPDAPRETVLEGVATFTRVCLYERPGVAELVNGEFVAGRSDPVPMPRPVEDAVHDLHALLQAADIPGPYVLVGHSLGGLIVRLYTAAYPNDVTGMVLIDAVPEHFHRHRTADQWEVFMSTITAPMLELAGDPGYETIDVAAAVETMGRSAAAHPFPPMPLFVLARDTPPGLSGDESGASSEAFTAAWLAAQEDLAALSPLSRITVTSGGDHTLPQEDPELVIRAIARVVTATREPNAFRPGATPDP